jgi:di/tricarboxylate transporter
MIFYAIDKIPLELTSIIIVSCLLLFFHFFPSPNISTSDIFSGFANSALISVICLLVVGQAVVQTGALNEVANIISRISGNNAIVSISISLLVVMIVSAILNNTPVVVIFIPILVALAKSYNMSVSKVMLPLSYVAILGGMTTLIGTSTNLLVSGILQEMGHKPLGFFDFTFPGIVMASVGFLYVLFIAPKLLPDRVSFAKTLVGDDERQFIAQIEVDKTSDFVGKAISDKTFSDYPQITVRMIQRGEHAFLPPYDANMTVRSRDILVVSATRKDLTDLLAKQPSSLLQNNPGASVVSNENSNQTVLQADVSLAEIIITPTSRMIGRNLEQVGFHHNHNLVVLGIQRESRIIRAKVSEIRLAAGDVLLVMGKIHDIMNLRDNKDLLLLEWSTQEIHSGKKAKHAATILTMVVALSAFEIVPIAISAFIGATAVIVSGCLNVRQAKRSIDSQVFLIVVASLAIGVALQETGGASFLAHGLINLMSGASAVAVMSALFLMMVAVTNVLSNNACGVLFTPIAVEVAMKMDAPVNMFVFAVIFASSCSFITPIGYQTNLLVMGPGHHKFSDFIRCGLPLAILMWITYTVFAWWYFGS